MGGSCQIQWKNAQDLIIGCVVYQKIQELVEERNSLMKQLEGKMNQDAEFGQPKSLPGKITQCSLINLSEPRPSVPVSGG